MAQLLISVTQGRNKNQWFPRYLGFEPCALLFTPPRRGTLLNSPLVLSKVRPNIAAGKFTELCTSFRSPTLGRSHPHSSLDLLRRPFVPGGQRTSLGVVTWERHPLNFSDEDFYWSGVCQVG